MENEWEEEINKKGKELTYFSKEVNKQQNIQSRIYIIIRFNDFC